MHERVRSTAARIIVPPSRRRYPPPSLVVRCSPVCGPQRALLRHNPANPTRRCRMEGQGPSQGGFRVLRRLRVLFVMILVLLSAGVGEPTPADASGGLVPMQPSRPPRTGYRERWAIIVGIDHYVDESVPTLQFAVNDATAFRDLLIKEFSFPGDHIRFLSDKQANLANFQDAFTHWLPSKGVDANDAVLVFFAGHGFIAPDGVEGYLATTELRMDRKVETSIPVRWIKNHLASPKVLARHKLILLDSCYSGALFQRAGGNLGTRRDALAQQFTTAAIAAAAGDNLAWYFLQPAFMGISAGRYTPVSDGTAEAGHSVFTSTLLAVMRERADSKRPDHAFTFRELAVQVETRVRGALVSRQIPDWGAIDGAGDFVFVPDPKHRRMTPTEERIEAEKIRRAVAISGPGGTLQSYRVALAALAPLAGREDQWSLRQGGLLELSALRSSLPRLLLPPAKASLVQFSPDGKLAFVASEAEAVLVKLPEGTVTPLVGFTGKVARAAFSPDGQLLAVGDSQKAVRVFTVGAADGGRPLARLKSHILQLAFSPDGRHLAVSDAEQVVVLDPLGSTSQGERTPSEADESGEPIRYIAFIDNQHLLFVRGDEVRLWQFTGSKAALLKTDVEGVTAVTLSADRATLILAADRRVWLIPIDAGKPQSALPRTELLEHPDRVMGFDIAGSRLLTTCEDWRLRIFRIGDREIRREPEHELPLVGSRVMFARFVAGGAQVVTGGDDLLGIWDVETGQRLATLEGLDVAPTPERADAAANGQVLAIDREGNARLWDPPLCKRPYMRLEGHNGPVLAITFSPGGDLLGTAGQDKTALVWDATSGLPRKSTAHHGGAVLSIAFAQTKPWLVTGSEDGFARVWEVGGNQVGESIASAGRATSVAWIPGRTSVAIASSSGIVNWWEPGAASKLRQVPAFAQGKGLAILSRNGRWAAFVDADGVHAIDLQKGEEVSRERSRAPTALAVSEQGPVVVWAEDGAIEVFDYGQKRRRRIEIDPTDPPWLITLSQDARTLLIVRAAGGLLYDLTKETLERPQRLAADPGAAAIQTASFAPDGNTVAVGNRIGAVQLFETVTGSLVQTLPEHHGRPVRALAFSPDGTHLASGGDDRVVHIADLRPAAVVRVLCEGLANSPHTRTDPDDVTARSFCAQLPR